VVIRLTPRRGRAPRTGVSDAGCRRGGSGRAYLWSRGPPALSLPLPGGRHRVEAPTAGGDGVRCHSPLLQRTRRRPATHVGLLLRPTPLVSPGTCEAMQRVGSCGGGSCARGAWQRQQAREERADGTIRRRTASRPVADSRTSRGILQLVGWEGASRAIRTERWCLFCARWHEPSSRHPGWTPRRLGRTWIWTCPDCSRTWRPRGFPCAAACANPSSPQGSSRRPSPYRPISVDWGFRLRAAMISRRIAAAPPRTTVAHNVTTVAPSAVIGVPPRMLWLTTRNSPPRFTNSVCTGAVSAAEMRLRTRCRRRWRNRATVPALPS
jgi:hypothetical protein